MKRIFFCIFSFSLFFNTIITAQSITFQKVLIEPGTQYFLSVIQTSDEGYIAVGRNRISFAEDWMYIVRFNKYGDTVWTRKINREEASSITKTLDGNYALSGGNGSLVKFDIKGNILNIGEFYDENARISKLLQANDGSYFMCGYYFTLGLFYPYLVKFDNNENLMWDTIYTINIFDGIFADMVFSNENNIVLTGNFKPTSLVPFYLFLTKINQQGNQIWFTSVNNYFYPNPISIAKINNSYFVSGSYNDNDAFIAKYNEEGVFQWLNGYDTTYMSVGYSLTSSNSGGAVYTGYIDSGAYINVRVRKIDTNSFNTWYKSYGLTGHNPISQHISETYDSGFVIVGYADFQSEDGYILKINKNGELFPEIGINTINNEIPMDFKLYQNYPNPFNPITIIKFDIAQSSTVVLKIFDIQGQEIKTLINEKLIPSKYSIIYNVEGLSSGVYFYQLFVIKDQNILFIKSLKLIILK